MTENPYTPPTEAESSKGAQPQGSLGIPIAIIIAVGGIMLGFIRGGSNSDPHSSMTFNLLLFGSLGLGAGVAYLVFRSVYQWLAERFSDL